MAARYELVDLGFSTADAEHISFEWRNSQLILQFVDWKENPVSVVFQDVAGVQWNEESYADQPEVRNDTCYEVHQSDWTSEYVRRQAFPRQQCVRHLVLCFNAVGVLEVLCTGLTTPKLYGD